jgi:ferredoxin-NADP reductase/mono/diheme cytochrome c family protein
MSSISASLVLGGLFVSVGAANVWLVLQASASVKNAGTSARLIAAHRVGGYVFILLYCAMSYFMIGRMREGTGSASAGTMIHLTVALLLSPLLFLKVLIARYYRSYHGFLLPIGLLIFVLSFVLVAITAGPYLLHNADLRSISLEEIDLKTTIDLTRAAATMQQRCSTCHNLDRVVGARKDARGWLATVNRMRGLPASGISEDDVKTIVSFLVSQYPPGATDSEARFAVARALVTQRCAACHSLEKVYKATKTPAQWRETVAEMVSNAQSDGRAGVFQPGEDEQITEFLSATQTPEAVSRRKAQASAASAAGVSLVIPKLGGQTAPAPPLHRPTLKVALLSFVGCLVVAVLSVRRRGKTSVSSAPALSCRPAAASAEVAPTAALPSSNTIVLQLVRITPQTADSKTLRFAVTGIWPRQARPGQFLTFTLLFGGQKVIRSYSICSSPAATGYIEITPKRIENGRASVFLNDRAAIGLTVEATGPFGQFCFDETRHKRVVLIAGGSGITPMMAMLRYMDDFCLPTMATLLYCVRTERDVIFEKELAELTARLGNFQYHPILSQATDRWTGLKGRLNPDIIVNVVKELQSSDFFLCGPAPFMEATRRMLAELRVHPERIHQESFGNFATPPARPGKDSGLQTGTVEFVHSGKTCPIRADMTLLQVAEENGVAIRSACRQGQCGTCKTRLLAGHVTMDTEQGLPEQLKAEGFVLTCVGRANGPVKLDA